MEMTAARNNCSEHTEFCVRLARIEDKIDLLFAMRKEDQDWFKWKAGIAMAAVGTISGIVVKLL
jgi:hypothetical protein